MNRNPIGQQLRESVDKWGYIKLKSFSTAKKTACLQNGRKSANYTSDEGLITRIYRELKKLNLPKHQQSIEQTGK
jgi:hypothetical protein